MAGAILERRTRREQGRATSSADRQASPFDVSLSTEPNFRGPGDIRCLGLSNDRAFKPLLQAVRELAVRDKQESERRLVEALATQLRMSRKMIVVANEMKEVSLLMRWQTPTKCRSTRDSKEESSI